MLADQDPAYTVTNRVDAGDRATQERRLTRSQRGNAMTDYNEETSSITFKAAESAKLLRRVQYLESANSSVNRRGESCRTETGST